MAKHRNRIRLLTARDQTLYIPLAQAQEMLAKGEAWAVAVYRDPATCAVVPAIIREARSITYKDEARDRRGRRIHGVMHPDPDRRTCRTGVSVFDRHPVQGADQGRAFPPRHEQSPAEREWSEYTRAYRRSFR